jgi:dipeptidase E
MRLFLASRVFGKYVQTLIDMANGNRVLVVFNALDGHFPLAKLLKKVAINLLFIWKGFRPKNLDLRKYFGRQNELRKLIDVHRPAVIFAVGGNPFVLRRALSQSGLDKIIQKNLANDKYVYAGCSTGAMVASPSMQYYKAKYTPDDNVPKKYKKGVTNAGMNLTQLFIVPHCDRGWFKKSATEIRHNLVDARKCFVELNDSDVFVVNGDKEELLKYDSESDRGKK